MHTLYKCTFFFGPMLGLIAKYTPSIFYTCNHFQGPSYNKGFYKCTHVTCITCINSKMYLYFRNIYCTLRTVDLIFHLKKIMLTDTQKYELVNLLKKTNQFNATNYYRS